MVERRISESGFDDFCKEIRDGQIKTLSGYAAVYYDGTPETEYRLWDGAVERIERGAFDKSLAEKHDVRALFNHNPELLLGRVSAETLELSTDERGLGYQVELGNTTVAKDVREHVRRGDLTGSSFAFLVDEQDWTKDGKKEVRVIKKVRLLDVGPVTYPAYEGTSVTSREDLQLAETRSAYDAWKAAEPEKLSPEKLAGINQRVDYICRTSLRHLKS